MTSMPSLYRLCLLLVSAAGLCLAATGPAHATDVEQGRYVFFAAGCISCHTADQPLAGGRPLETPFGTFYPPNITPSAVHGIGTWKFADLERALRQGLSPRGEHYYPAFPYPSYTGMMQRDMQALYAFLMQQPVAARQNRPHVLYWPYSHRGLLGHWKNAGFAPGVYTPDPDRSARWNRGAYLATALGHCGECHTPRGFLGIPHTDRYLAGSCAGPEGEPVPNITPDRQTGIGTWSREELVSFLGSGRRPDGRITGALMMEVLGTSCMRLSPSDRLALADYLLGVAAVHNDLAVLCAPYDDSMLED